MENGSGKRGDNQLGLGETPTGRRHRGSRRRLSGYRSEGLRQHPRSDWLWRQLASNLIELDRLEEAEKALDEAHSLNSKSDWLWRYSAALHRKRKNLQREIAALESLRTLGTANATDLNQLGIAYYNHRNLAKAEECYRLSAANGSDPWHLFNMGLVFSDPEVSREADAADRLGALPGRPRSHLGWVWKHACARVAGHATWPTKRRFSMATSMAAGN